MLLSDIFNHSLLSIEKNIFKNRKSTFSGLANKTAKAFFVSSIFNNKQKQKRNFIWVLNNKNDVIEIKETLNLFLNPKEWEIKTFSIENKEIEKIEWVINLNKDLNKNIIYLFTQKDIIEKFPSMDYLEKEKIMFFENEKINILNTFNSLIEKGFEASQDVLLQKAQHRRSGDILDIFPIGEDQPVKIEIEFDKILSIHEYLPEKKKLSKKLSKIDIYPCHIEKEKHFFFEFLKQDDVLIIDDLEDVELIEDKINKTQALNINFTSFIDSEGDTVSHLRYLSVLKFFNLFDLINDLRTKIQKEWEIVILTKRIDELKNIFQEEKILFNTEKKDKGVYLLDAKDLKHIPSSFQNQEEKILLLTDREIFQIRKSRKIKAIENVNLEFLTSLKSGDFVVHTDHGIGRFFGICEQQIDNIKREFLEIAYAGNDKLFIPIDQADKVARFVADNGVEPKITRLGSQEWRNICKGARKETEKIAKELLKIQAMRSQAKGCQFEEDTERQKEFEKTFPYEETPGQIKAIMDTKSDMENIKPMDRLICGDVGFGKTEVAMRAAFKAVENQKQVAIVSPVTILTDQHYKSFKKRMDTFGVKIEMLSRFKGVSEQKRIIEDLKKGKIDIIIGTHRLLQEDIKFFNLGLVVIDEEQRFGVKQKERFKQLRKEIDILTMSATPIPRTLNLALHKLRDITTITTPPPGRLPVMTEIRKYSDALIKTAIEKEMERGGQIFFLHNRVETIESIAQKLRTIMPNVRFVVAHGQMKPHDLEDRIMAFKNKEYNVLISSTIIENGIDLPNANTLIVRNAEQFGLAQLYQLRGRIGRGKVQAYAYFLYQTQKLKPEAKKRLRAIAEASDLGSGFQIAMKDLEIRGAGDVLGVNQHGTVNSVGVHHFLKLLNQTIEEIKQNSKGLKEEEKDVIIEIPIDSYIPSTFITDQKEKILAYQQLASVKGFDALDEITKDLEEEFGRLPKEVRNLLKILKLKLHTREAKLVSIRSVPLGQDGKEIQIHLSKYTTAIEIMNLLQYNDKWQISGEKLKINVKDLGFNWFDELINAVCLLKKKNEKIT